MSLIIVLKIHDGIFVCSDSLGIKFSGHAVIKTKGEQKFYSIQTHPLIIGYCGVESVGQSGVHYANSILRDQSDWDKFLSRLSNYVKECNDNFVKTTAAIIAKRMDLSPLTGFILAGFFKGRQALVLILADGKIIKSNNYIILGYASESISPILENEYKPDLSRNQAKKLIHRLIKSASILGTSNTKCYKCLITKENITKMS